MRRSRLCAAGVWATLVIVGVALGACGDAGDLDGGDGYGETVAGEAPAADSVESRVFLREPAEDAPTGRLTLHLVVAESATREQIRQVLVRTMEEAAAADTALIAIRAIAYTVAPPRAAEAEMAPVGWGEWLPPGGWTAPDARRGQLHRSTTYSGAPPEW